MKPSWTRSAAAALPFLALVACNFGQSTTVGGASFDAGDLETSTGGTLTATPASEGFGTVAIGMQSASVPIVVTNTGGTTSAALVASLSGANAADFGVDSDGCSKQTLLPGASCTVSVHFRPTLASLEQASLAIADGTVSLGVALSGTGGVAGALGLSPSTQDFGTAAAGSKPGTPTTFTLKNTASAATGVVTVALSGSDATQFTVTSDACSTKPLAAGATCAVGVAFAPTTAGAKAASLTATVAGATTVATASLSGTALPGAAFTVAPSPFDFGSVQSGTSNPPTQTFTVTNSGGSASGTPSVVPSGAHAADFALTANTCTAPVAALGTCTFGLAFTPSTTALETATVTVSAAATTSATDMVQGTGLPPASLTITPATQDLGSVVQGATGADVAFTVTNGGGVTSGALAMTLQGTNAGQFALGTDGCTGTTLAPGGTCTVDAHAAPTTTGPVGAVQAQLQVAGTPGGTTAATLTATTIQQATLTIAPTTQAMGTVAQLGTSGTIPFVVTNSGGVASGTLTATLGGTNAAQYAMGPDACTGNPLGAGKSCTVDVSFSPTAGTLGVQAASLSVTATPGGTTTSSLTGTAVTAAALGVAPASKTYASTVQGGTTADVTFTVTNGGGVTTGTLASSLGGANVGQFVLGTDGCTGQTLAPMASCTVNAHFAPSIGTLGTQQATLEVAGTPGGTATADLTGNATSPLSIAPASPTLATGTYGAPGATTVLTVTSTSPGSVGPLTVTAPTNFALDTTKTTCSGAKLTAAAPTCAVGVYLDPSAPTVTGTVTGTLQVAASATTSATDTLTATALAPATLVITQAGNALPYSFGFARENQTTTQQFVLTNTGTGTSGPVTLAITGSAPGSTDFTVTQNQCAAALGPNVACSFAVSFVPSTLGTLETATLGVTTTIGVGSSGTVSGTGGQATLEFLNGAGAVVTTYDIGGALVSVPGAVVPPTTADFTLVNTGTVATDDLTTFQLPDGYTLTTFACKGEPLPAGGKCALVVSFQNTTPCASVAANLEMTDNISSATLALSATGLSSGANYVLTYTPYTTTAPNMTLTLGTTGTFNFTVTNCGNAPGLALTNVEDDAEPNYFDDPVSPTAANGGCQDHPALTELETCTFTQVAHGAAVTQIPEDDNITVSQNGGNVLSVEPTLSVIQ